MLGGGTMVGGSEGLARSAFRACARALRVDEKRAMSPRARWWRSWLLAFDQEHASSNKADGPAIQRCARALMARLWPWISHTSEDRCEEPTDLPSVATPIEARHVRALLVEGQSRLRSPVAEEPRGCSK